MIYRKAILEDIEQLVVLRKKQLVDEGIEPSIDIDKELYGFFQMYMASDLLVEWLAVDNNRIIATAAIIFYDFPPTYTNKSGKKGYITNMYTAPGYRNQGIATSLLDRLVEEASKRDIKKLWLGASTMGRSVYKSYGFSETNEWLELNIKDKGKVA